MSRMPPLRGGGPLGVLQSPAEPMSAEERTAGRVLLVDDDATLRFALRKALGRLGYEVEEADSAAAAIARLDRGGIDAAIVDLHLDPRRALGSDERGSGLEVLRAGARWSTRLLVLTGHGSVDAAVTAMKLGAFSFLEKPIDAAVLGPLLAQAVGDVRKAQGAPDASFAPPLLGRSAAMDEVRAFIARVGPTDETVAVYGETGAGKEVVARHVHLASRRRGRAFVALNAAAVPRDLVESELFGHKKGSFTGATSDRAGLFREADGGTLFIDELGELPLESQAKLLRALEERRIRPVGESREIAVDVRIVAATNRDLWMEVQAGRFREDLYFRLQVFPLRLPPLRERVEDIVPLAEHLLSRIGGTARRIDDEARRALESYGWPGNVRELFNVLRRASLFATGETLDGPLVQRMITASIFGQAGSQTTSARASAPMGAPSTPRNEPPARVSSPGLAEPTRESAPEIGRPLSLAELERRHIEQTLAAHGGNVTKAAISLGIDRRTLQRKLRGYGISVADEG
ncbi:MAG: sigma 54-interacting transcriptional regulator [Sandaracinaceae bacterium]